MPIIVYKKTGASEATTIEVHEVGLAHEKHMLLSQLLEGRLDWVRIYLRKGSRDREYWTRTRDNPPALIRREHREGHETTERVPANANPPAGVCATCGRPL
jgi:hypothetical protein